MKIIFSILFLLCGNLFAWTGEDYGKYGFAGFEKLDSANQTIDVKNIDYSLLNAAVFYETNKERVLHGKSILRYEPFLEKAAQGHCADMVNYNFFSHESPVSGQRTVRERINKAGLDTKDKIVGENLTDIFAIEYEEGRQVYPPDKDKDYFSYEVDGTPIKNHTYIGFAKSALITLMNSKEHKENLLNNKYVYLGVGSAYYEDAGTRNMPRFKVAQDFCSDPIKIRKIKQ
jgi:uncharacterized protein YkwD